MYSSLRKLANVFTALSVVSLIVSGIAAFNIYSLHNYYHESGAKVFICCMACVIFIPILFICLSAALRKIAEEMNAESIALASRIRELESK